MNTEKDKKVIGVSYLYTFYDDIQKLIINFAQYQNLMLELEYRYPNNTESLTKADEVEKATITQWLQEVRLYITSCHIRYKTLTPILKLPKSELLENSYKIITSKFVINRDDLEVYVIEMNKVLISGVIQELLENNQNLIGAIYAERTETKPAANLQ
jgi:hypothetical protein